MADGFGTKGIDTKTVSADSKSEMVDLLLADAMILQHVRIDSVEHGLSIPCGVAVLMAVSAPLKIRDASGLSGRSKRI